MKYKHLLAILSITTLIAVNSSSFADDVAFEKHKYEKGDEGYDVRLLQIALDKDDVFVGDEITTYFGKITLNSVKAFQKKHGLTADGIVGKGTIGKMNALGLFPTLDKKIYKKEQQNKDIITLQQALEIEGLFQGDYSESFGPKTEKAVRAFQTKYHLTEDGIVGGECISKFLELGLIAVNRTPVTVEMKTEIPIASTDAPSDTPESENVETAADKTVPATKDSTTASSSADNPAEEEIATPADTAAEQADSIPDTTEVAAPDLPTSENDLTRSKEERKIGEDLDWWNIVKPMFTRQETTLLVEDFETGTTFTLMVSGGTNHGDVEPLTAEDAKIIKQVWGGQWSWTRRPVIVYINEKAIAASMTAQPHAGRDEFEYGETVHNRSGDFGTGYNFDFVKGNGISGHMDLHFKNSTRHNDGKQDSKHQACINIAAGKTN